jgi:hypothetical protein
MKTSELTGTALDWTVAKCEGYNPGVITIEETIAGQIEQERLHGNRQEVIEFLNTVVRSRTLPTLCNIAEDGYKYVHVLHYGGRSWPFQYSTDWSQGGPIIYREGIRTAPTITRSAWMAQIRHTKSHPLVAHPVLAGWTNANGPTPLIAAMRCFVASRLGDEVDVPKELL